MKKTLARIHVILSHHSHLYAFVVGIGIVLFWRGVWHSVDLIHLYVNARYVSTLDLSGHPWWDGPVSFIIGCIVLYCSRAFVSSFIGNELILSGLRAEERLTKKTESEVLTEVATISAIKHEINIIGRKLDELEANVKDHHLK